MHQYADIYLLQRHSTKLAHTSPNQATVEGSSGTNTMTYTTGSRYSFWNS
jgi:hypothetical protein